MPPPGRGAWPPGAGAPTCEAEAEGAAGSAVAVAHLAGQWPCGPPAHAQQPQAVLVIIWHGHLACTVLFQQHLFTPAGTPAATSQPQTHCPINSSHPIAPWPPPDPQTAPALAPSPQSPQTAHTPSLALPPKQLSALSTPQTASRKKNLPLMQLCTPLDITLECTPSPAPAKDPPPTTGCAGSWWRTPPLYILWAILVMGQATSRVPCPTSSR